MWIGTLKVDFHHETYYGNYIPADGITISNVGVHTPWSTNRNPETKRVCGKMKTGLATVSDPWSGYTDKPGDNAG